MQLQIKIGTPPYDKNSLVKIYTAMLSVRMVDEKGMQLQRQGRIGFYLPNFGEEALQVGSVVPLKEGDIIVPSYRVLGTGIYRGLSFENIFNNLFGNELDITQGKAMPICYCDKSINFVTISAPIGTQLSHAVGIAYALKYKKTKNVAVTYCGDGATSSNDFHCALNFAGVLKVPVVFFVNNNQRAISVPIERQTASETIAIKAKAYGFEGIRIDGNNIFEVIQTATYAIEKARDGKGPTLVECLTFRMGPHSTSDDPRRYVPKECYEEWKKKDPIEFLYKFLIEKKIITEEEDKKIKADISKKIDEAVKKAESAKAPPVESLVKDVFEHIPKRLLKQLKEIQE
jgi:pyruvate dehydrogenase E1 component alpha subunit